ncbi:DoxX family protein [Undibacterium sp. CY18W]|uniref:DoxX family protein n=1 Tax=Undibacterium hunanense TaxID=2762292 RepID=A0ABR6ZUV9_9BURK|nr:DoxX family protein [Undibacterium hunanense]MBC3919409.1 DoxX family protein [Undibacterium hunanense]
MYILQYVHTLSRRFDQNLNIWAGSVLCLALRIYVGWQFFKAGMVKVSDWSATLSLFQEEYMVPVIPPELAAWMGAGGELILPVLLVVGIFSRPAALALFAVNAMAVISYPALFMLECPAAINAHFYWGILLLVLVSFGPGKFSVDEWLGKRGN